MGGAEISLGLVVVGWPSRCAGLLNDYGAELREEENIAIGSIMIKGEKQKMYLECGLQLSTVPFLHFEQPLLTACPRSNTHQSSISYILGVWPTRLHK